MEDEGVENGGQVVQQYKLSLYCQEAISKPTLKEAVDSKGEATA